MSDAEWSGGLAAVTLFTEDMVASRAFYADGLGLTEVHRDDDATAYRLGSAERSVVVNVLDVRAATELVDPARVGDADSGPRAVMTVEVEDVDAACARLAARGLTPHDGPLDRPWGVRTASFQDPSGHLWELAH